MNSDRWMGKHRQEFPPLQELLTKKYPKRKTFFYFVAAVYKNESDEAINNIRIQSEIDLLNNNNKLKDLNVLFNSQNLSAINSL